MACILALVVPLALAALEDAPPPPSRALRRPARWDSDQMEHSGAICVKNESSVVNTRLVFYSPPEGRPPPGGWPIYTLFQPWGASAEPWGTAGHVAPICGPLYPPFVVQSCLTLMKERCPLPAGNSYDGTRQCYNCTSHLRRADMAAYRAANCSSEQTNELCAFQESPPETVCVGWLLSSLR